MVGTLSTMAYGCHHRIRRHGAGGAIRAVPQIRLRRRLRQTPPPIARCLAQGKRRRSSARDHRLNGSGRRALTTPACARSLPGGSLARSGAPLPSRRARLSRQRLSRRHTAALALQRATRGPRPVRRYPLAGAATRRLRAPLRRRLGLTRGAQLDARAARLRQADRDRLLRRSRAMLAFTDVVDLLADELAGLRRGRLALPLVPACPLDSLFLRHCASSTAPYPATRVPSPAIRHGYGAAGG